MDCNRQIYNGLIDLGEISCAFCNKQLQDISVKHDLCCDKQDIINNNGMKLSKLWRSSWL